MNRYNVTVQIFANVAILAKGPEKLEEEINLLLEDTLTVEIGGSEFVIEEGGKVTGVYDVRWEPVGEIQS